MGAGAAAGCPARPPHPPCRPAPAMQALIKTAAGQATLFPLYTSLFFTYMGLLEGLTPAQVQGPLGLWLGWPRGQGLCGHALPCLPASLSMKPASPGCAPRLLCLAQCVHFGGARLRGSGGMTCGPGRLPARLPPHPPQCVAKVRQAFPPTFVTGSVFWPTANIFNFMLVPPHLRVPYVNVAGVSREGSGTGAARTGTLASASLCAAATPGAWTLPEPPHAAFPSPLQLFWNAWLSYENSTKGRVGAAAGAAAVQQEKTGAAGSG